MSVTTLSLDTPAEGRYTLAGWEEELLGLCTLNWVTWGSCLPFWASVYLAVNLGPSYLPVRE